MPSSATENPPLLKFARIPAWFSRRTYPSWMSIALGVTVTVEHSHVSELVL